MYISTMGNQPTKNDVEDFEEELIDNGVVMNREISQFVTLDVFENKKYGNYTLIVNLEEIQKSESVLFYIKIFTNYPIIFEELPQTLEYTFNGVWN